MGFSPAWADIAAAKGLIAPAPVPGPPLDCEEKTLQSEIIKHAKAHGWIAHHHTISKRSEPGWPDLVLIRDGKLIVRELKTETGVVSPEQTVWLCALQMCGVDAGVWRPRDWARIVEILE